MEEGMDIIIVILISLGSLIILLNLKFLKNPNLWTWKKLGLIGFLFGLILPRVVILIFGETPFTDGYLPVIFPIFYSLFAIGMRKLFDLGFRNNNKFAKTTFIFLLIVFILTVLISIWILYGLTTIRMF